MLVLVLVECVDDVIVMFAALILGCVVVIESDPNCEAIIEVSVRLPGEELLTIPGAGTKFELSLLLFPIDVTGLGGGWRL